MSRYYGHHLFVVSSAAAAAGGDGGGGGRGGGRVGGVGMRKSMTTTTKVDDMPQHCKTHTSRRRGRRPAFGSRNQMQEHKSCHSSTSSKFGINQKRM